ncbi:uncharacterized protein J7T54_007007 [Emericellopsis cladophorae]|uniref:37S ribosomal protein rsm22 n=1 Tax=Emericellopsis cladophorae TaxID=2686198 RepID=A0A9P9Y8Q6_9HYPO|nr:uncharacterized protein J7T54_007007 [Emericellopsis cladophorae]KAI6785365.1 hypothetical protein J7T54_007007 [Emericellopsis cladophorae]
MSLDVWPPIPPADLRLKEAETQARELGWITAETLRVCKELKHGLEDCYALLAPVDPGSTLVMSTARSEKVKGTITRVGTRIVKGTLNLQLRTMPPHNLQLSPQHSIHIPALDKLHNHLNESLDLLSVILSAKQPPDAKSLAQTLTLLSESIAASAALLKGPPLTTPDQSWTTSSCPPGIFSPPLAPNISFHIGLQDSCIVLLIRALEPCQAAVHTLTKLGLAIGTVRRLEHDEMDSVFKYNVSGYAEAGSRGHGGQRSSEATRQPQYAPNAEDVYVREKVRVESGDPSLISLYSKLGFLSHVLGQTRRNLAAVIGYDMD